MPKIYANPSKKIIDITLEEVNDTIKYHGTHVGHFDKWEQLELNAQGKAGERGKDGIDGDCGADGSHGLDATQCSLGKDGTDGENGKPGTPGTNGGDGEPGGQITVTVHKDDLALLDAISTDVSGGPGGEPGQHGKGGAGGKGGLGGNSYSWCDYQTEIRYGYDPYHHGHGYCHTSPGFYSVGYTVPKTNPGGRNGRNGQPGVTPTTPLLPGQKGADGTVSFRVLDGFQTTKYNHPYHLTVRADCVDAQGNRRTQFEYGEQAFFSCQVGNQNTMPSPKSEDIEIVGSSSSSSIQFIKDSVSLNEAKSHSSEIEAPAPIKIYFKYPTTINSNPLSEDIIVSCSAHNTRLKRLYRNATDGEESVHIGYPVAFNLPSSYSIPKSECFDLQIDVRTCPGFQVITSYRRYSIAINGQEIHENSYDALPKRFSHLYPLNDSHELIHTQYATVTLYWTVLHGKKKAIQESNVEIHISKPYTHQPNCPYLLVIDNHTQHRQAQLWYNTLSSWVPEADVSMWNISAEPDLIINTQPFTVIGLGHSATAGFDNKPTKQTIKVVNERPQNIIYQIQFSQKIETVFDSAVSIKNQHHHNFVKALMNDLEDEQIRIARQNTPTTWRDWYNNEYSPQAIASQLECAQTLKAYLMQLASNPIAMETFTPLVVQLIARMQFTAKQQTSFGTWIANWFKYNAKESIKKVTDDLAEETLQSIAEKSEESLDVIKEKIDLNQKLHHIIALGESHTGFHIFSKKPNAAEVKAAKYLLNQCSDKPDEKDDTHIQPLMTSSWLRRVYKDYQRLYLPAENSTETKSISF